MCGGIAVLDYDNDGWMDIFLVNGSTLEDLQTKKCHPSRLYHNNHDGTFTDVTVKSGLTHCGWGFGVAVGDYDNDGWEDLYINYLDGGVLYHNNHNGTFTDAAVQVGVAFSESGRVRAGMGTDAGDYDGSGWQSLVIGNFTNESMSLYRNDGSGLFVDEEISSGIRQMSLQALTFACFFFDYDLDGRLDIFAANGHVSDDISVVQPTLKYAQPAILFHNNGNRKFEDASAKVGAGLQQPVVGRGAAYLDYDNDGDLDLVITSNNGAARLLRNENGNQNDMLRVKLVGVRSNRDGIGAKVTLTTSAGARLFRMVKTGSSYASQSELPLTFGLGKPEAGKMVSIEIVWPSGRKDSLSKISANQFITVKEGSGITVARPIVFGKSAP